MRLYAFAALLALPLLGSGSGAAKADYYCCGRDKGDEREIRYFLVVKKTAVFDCDAHHCETKIRLRPDTKIKAKCTEYGWCKIEPRRLDNAWVPENCLKEIGDRKDREDEAEEEERDRERDRDREEERDRRPWRRY
ncbi:MULTISPECIES: hypothetical protein [Rhodomicrobium]|uniref:hypothetical protein n=1 Tax=Rhodomicrobium TaxID=1068 RepID=UPI000B4AE314|nr:MULTISPECIES: hypothetical protein [Rhodomicrobium]